MFAPSSPVTGLTIAGLTTPTYTLSADQGVDVNWKQFLVSALGGTQTGVRVHSASDPFTVAMSRPKVLKPRPATNPAGTGFTGLGTKNNYVLVARKGVIPITNAAPEVALVRMEFAIPSGSEANDLINLKAMLSCLIGYLWAEAATDIVDTLQQGSV